jgi:hypothetical protein
MATIGAATDGHAPGAKSGSLPPGRTPIIAAIPVGNGPIGSGENGRNNSAYLSLIPR